ncbi:MULTISPECIES: relaxase/mobilization nuclease domain-containing protein [Bradyrhizobium]|uniref:Type IV secretory pathway, VirD2 components (Relaxase) n=1 Tax=Bradyrhizobium yuanmingense TaxID=108015 RepID=A0A1C3XH59_9BRAD|nr:MULTISPECIES: relaxase/mobilization nuclease domain-containing protein [Bradyrhizobium]MCA1544676.1 relaxase/mobilization nuclease domain-containing protein [Bradyrhizobium sp. NBAIM32]TWI18303.1 type IV secretory pathway VirD2 relaxase [Bradyrhizobium yuanmingense]UWU93708.1 relaxase/mobilization nuclease domain-containing protein [Bradyrhizobium sp. CB1015]SCB51612.1 Type IV secretory pathway, VirD2 components (relaxase) [Bradyrhizobium yuanmingense]
MSRRPPRPNDLAFELPPISYVWETPNRRPGRAEWDIPDQAAPGRLTPAMRAKLERIVRRAPEVMVKITGRTKSVAHLKSHLAYITRNGELDAETEQGATLAGRSGLKDLQQRWEDDASLDGKRRRDGSLSINIILSMPAGTDAVAVKDSARAFAIQTFGCNHDYVFVQHLDDKHPHVHLTVRSLGHDGKRLNPRKADLQAWRERFAGELRLRGISAEATPRRTRGRVRKGDRGAVLAMRKRKITPDVDQLARKEVLSEVRSSKTAKHPWDEQIKSRQDAIRRRYLDYAAELQRSGVPADVELARQVRQFVDDMPGIETRRHALKNELSELASSRRRDVKQDVHAEGRDKTRGDEPIRGERGNHRT